jgi:hypothetical protein|tara:strand:- start:472 stop:732 length:261 start_codon:yes stop_codon:yes gene_type:complete
MNEKSPFGTLLAEDFEIGDIVEWSKWDSTTEEWVSNFGILVSIENKVVADRIISVSTIKPLNQKDDELKELFTIYLKPVIPNKKND